MKKLNLRRRKVIHNIKSSNQIEEKEKLSNIFDTNSNKKSSFKSNKKSLNLIKKITNESNLESLIHENDTNSNSRVNELQDNKQ
jgi:hypothetical protein